MVLISRFDLVLLFIFVLITAAVGADMWLIVHGFEQFSAGFWTFVTAVCTGEIVTFSLYSTVKKHASKWFLNKHPEIKELEEEENEQSN